MAEHMNQQKPTPMSAFDMMGRFIPYEAQQAGYEACVQMGLPKAEAYECTKTVAEQLHRDQPYEAQGAAMKWLDLTGAYRLIATLLSAALELEGKGDSETA